MGTVNNHDIMNEIAIRHGLTGAQANAIYRDFWELVRAYVADGHDVVFNQLLKIETVHKGERKARNPRTGEPITVPPRSVVKIRTRKKLRDLRDAAPLPALDGKPAERLEQLYTKWIDPKLR